MGGGEGREKGRGGKRVPWETKYISYPIAELLKKFPLAFQKVGIFMGETYVT